MEVVIGHGCGGSWHHDVNIGDEGSDGRVVYIICHDAVNVCSQFCHGGVLLMHPHIYTLKDAGDDQVHDIDGEKGRGRGGTSSSGWQSIGGYRPYIFRTSKGKLVCTWKQ